MKKTIMRVAALAAVALVTAVAIVGCGGGDIDVGSADYLERYLKSVGGGEGTEPPTPSKPKYNLKVNLSPDNGGRIIIDREEESYDSGMTVNITAEANDGFEFMQWDGDLGGQNDYSKSVTITMNDHKELTAYFQPNDGGDGLFKVTVLHYANTNVSRDFRYAKGNNVTITAGNVSPDELRFKEWIGDNDDILLLGDNKNNATATFTMPDRDVTLTASFVPVYEVVVNAGPGATGGGYYADGDIVTIKAGTPPDGKKFVRWTTTETDVVKFNSDSTETTAFEMPGKIVNVTAEFGAPPKTPPYTITFNTNGGISESPRRTDDAGKITSLPTPTKGSNCLSECGFIGWYIDLTNDQNIDTGYVLKSDITLYAHWTTLFKITVNAAMGGTVTCEPEKTSYLSGDQVSIIARPVQNYKFESWTVTGSNETFYPTTSINVTMKSDITITANFKWSGLIFIDGRKDVAKQYKMIETSNNIRWMAENLNYDTTASSCYDEDISNCDEYGRLYDWEMATKVCPSGWRLPSKDEWDSLIQWAGGQTEAGKNLKATSGWDKGNGTDQYGFSALPGGDRCVGDKCWGQIRSAAYWWTSDKKSDSEAYNKIIDKDNNIKENTFNKNHRLSVRCISNK